jgi:hypothetical protein
MSFNLGSLLSGLQSGLAVVEQLSATATALGAPTGLVTTVAKIGGALLETAQNVKQRVDEGKIVASSTDQAQLKTILETLQAKNDELAAYIEAH